jgi:TolA-binding protein
MQTKAMSVHELYEQGFQARCDGKYGYAKLMFESVLGQEPDHADAKWQMGLIQGFEGDFDGSLATLQNVVAANPKHIDALYDLGMTQMMLGMDEEACMNFHKVLSLNPDHEKAKQQIAYCG